MRVLAVDSGKVRVGLAVTDADGLIASPLRVIERRGACEAIRQAAEDLDVATIVVGLPLNMDGSEGPSAEDARALGERLRAAGFQVEYLDERLTTVGAERVLIESGHSRRRRREITDAVAAAILLEAYLARRRNARLGDRRWAEPPADPDAWEET
jgi:putative Holliday junction resolvase